MLAVERAIGAAVAALVRLVRVLDLDHLGAEHGELIGRERAGQHMGDVDDANAREGSGHGGLLRWRAARDRPPRKASRLSCHPGRAPANPGTPPQLPLFAPRLLLSQPAPT